MKHTQIYHKWMSMAQSTRTFCRCGSSKHLVRNCPQSRNDTGNNLDIVYSVTNGVANNKKCFRSRLLNKPVSRRWGIDEWLAV